jgi:hypothetical protein
MRIPEIPLLPSPRSEESYAALGFRYAPDQVGSRHKLGGEPTWLQSAVESVCPSCAAEMTFYGQLDSIGDEYVIADCGIVFVFICFICFTSKSIVQSA